MVIPPLVPHDLGEWWAKQSCDGVDGKGLKGEQRDLGRAVHPHGWRHDAHAPRNVDGGGTDAVRP
jgi:hypothetical protein